MPSSISQLTSRRDFLRFLGRSSSSIALVGGLGSTLGCSVLDSLFSTVKKGPFNALPPSSSDQIQLVPGFQSQTLVSWGDSIGKDLLFGDCCDFTAFLPIAGRSDQAFLWVNHEFFIPLFVSGHEGKKLPYPRQKPEVENEMKQVGGSLIQIQKEASGAWKLSGDTSKNFRIDGSTSIPFASPYPIGGSKVARGTLGNCAGGVTPWGSILTCEEGHSSYYGDVRHLSPGRQKKVRQPSPYGWESSHPLPPEHYGWVVEVNPASGKAKKLPGLGRFAHECATVWPLKNGLCAVYSGDDGVDQCVYKFISEKPGSLDQGTLYVAQLESGRWIPLDIRKNPILKKHFKDQTEVLVHTRKAAHLVGGTPLDRPEDIAIDPKTRSIYIALTKNYSGNHYGSLLKIGEKNADPLSLEFQSSTFLTGGEDTGVACPDNLAFDPRGNLWLTTDFSPGRSAYQDFGNNSLFYIPLEGKAAGQAFRVANAPHGAEFTGPSFSPDGKTLFLSVQHPGGKSRSLKNLTSHWPRGGGSIPLSSVVTLSGPGMDQLMS